MTRLRLLFALCCCCCSGLPALTVCLRVDGHSCLSAYWDTVTCVLKIPDDPAGRSSQSLKFTNTDSNEEICCPLVAANNTYRCVCKLKDGSDTFGSYDGYDVAVCRDSRCRVIRENFEPSQNIQLTPPRQAEVRQSPDTYDFAWTSGYENHRYLGGVLDYQLLLQTRHGEGNNTLSPNSREGSLSVPRSRPPADTAGCVRVRARPGHPDYAGTWSDWSPAKCWGNEAGEEGQANATAVLTKSLGPALAAVGVLLFVFYGPTARRKMETLSHAPSPVPFFKPLFQEHDGNLQEWLSPQGRFALTYEADETLTPDAVVVVAKPEAKEPEERRCSLRDASLPRAGFTPGQTAYVGLPETRESPRGASYTGWPCSVRGVDLREVEVVVASPPDDALGVTRADSGCSREDPTTSPEGSSPRGAVVDNPPPCDCNDYCILNRTAGGFAPVLLCKQESD